MAKNNHDLRGEMKTSWLSISNVSDQSDIRVNQYKKHLRDKEGVKGQRRLS